MSTKLSPALPLAVLTLGFYGCSSNADSADQENAGVEQFSINVEADRSRILAEEENLQRQQQTVESEREKLERTREEIAERLSSLSKNDRKQRAALEAEQRKLSKQEEELATRLTRFERERAKLDREKSALLNRLSELEAASDQSASLNGEIRTLRTQLAQQSRQIDSLKKTIENDRAGLKTQLDAIEALIRDMPQSAAPPSRVVIERSGDSAASAKSVKALKRDVESQISKKNLLAADLSPQAKDLRRKGDDALRIKDYDEAELYYSELLAIVSKTRVDRTFIEAKFARLERDLGGRKVDGVDKLLPQVSAAFSEGRWNMANRLINKIYRLVPGS